ncbi:hypothetical protein CTI12_AA177770 [Artemisia annua]|uniref:tRNA synthetases class I catalytic domain-containing protein n=1 Tax=Artemisia annua TaxID=35608 RepID=A0A2U1P9R7_ARTAN|nr:hypothetical protein CTI12_AA177770 [Artemisia annua]
MAHGKVSIYVCGVTAYDRGHIGHARAYVSFDVLVGYRNWGINVELNMIEQVVRSFGWFQDMFFKYMHAVA